MFLKIDDDLYKKIKEYTMVDYERIGEDLPSNSIIPIFEDLIYEIEKLKELIEDIEQDRNDNYKPITKDEMYE